MARPVLFVALMMASGWLASCSSEGDRERQSHDPFASRTNRQEDRFGEGFGKAFRADPNSEPANVSEADVKPVSRTAEPLDVE